MGAGVSEAWIPGGQQPARHADHRCPFMHLLQVAGTIHLPRPGAPERAPGTKAESWRAGDSRWSRGSTLSPIPLSPAPQPSPSYGRCGLVSGPLSPTRSPPGDGFSSPVRRPYPGESCWVSVSSAPKPHLLYGPRPHSIPDVTQQETWGSRLRPWPECPGGRGSGAAVTNDHR